MTENDPDYEIDLLRSLSAKWKIDFTVIACYQAVDATEYAIEFPDSETIRDQFLSRRRDLVEEFAPHGISIMIDLSSKGETISLQVYR